MRIAVVSLACCNPALRPQDQRYVERVREAARLAEVEAQVELVAASELALAVTDDQYRKVVPVFKRYGAAAAPALLIDGELVLYGGIPSLDKLVEMLSKSARDQGAEGSKREGG